MFDDQYIVYLGSWIIPIRICNPRNAFISSIVVSTHPWSTLWAAYKLVLSTIICTKARGNITMKNCKGFASKAAGMSVLKIQKTPERQCLPQPHSKNRHPWCRLPGCQGQTMLTRYPDHHRCPYHFQRNDHNQSHPDQSLTQNQKTRYQILCQNHFRKMSKYRPIPIEFVIIVIAFWCKLVQIFYENRYFKHK